MSVVSSFNNRLFWLYERYVGEPESAKDVYGYWIFVMGYVVGLGGIIFYLAAPGNPAVVEVGSELYFNLTKLSIAIAAGGLPIGLFGIILMLPIRRFAVWVSILGLAIAFVGVVTWTMYYPEMWPGTGVGGGVDNSPITIAVYTAGIALLAGVTALVPVLTGERAMFVEEEGVSEEPPIMIGDALQDMLFAVFRDDLGDWTWHIIHQEAVAASDSSEETRPNAESAIERLKSQIGQARLLEITTAAFRLYQTDEGEWRWLLMRDDGSVVAESGLDFDQRDGAEESVSFVKDQGPDAGLIDIPGAAFNYTVDRGEWRWELLDEDRQVLAETEESFNREDQAREASKQAAMMLSDARTLAVENLATELYEDGHGWSWRVLDSADTELLTSNRRFETRRNAESSTDQLFPRLADASLTVSGEPSFELYQEGTGYRWRLVDPEEEVVARNHGGEIGEDAAEATAKHFGDHAADAEIIEIEDSVYEIYPEDNEWHWRLVTDDREVVADSSEPHENPEMARESIERMRSQAQGADLIEFEHAAFQVYEAEGQEWRWRLIDEDGNVMADSGEQHESREAATKSMMTLKEEAPEAEMIDIEDAAFELFQNEDDEWGWRLIDEAGKMIAEGPHMHENRSGARTAMNELMDNLGTDVRTMQQAAFQSYTDGDSWRWRFITNDGTIIAEGVEDHPTRDDLENTIEDVRPAADAADLFAIGEVAIQVRERGGEWGYRVLNQDRETIAESGTTFDDQSTVETAVAKLRKHAADAPVFTIEEGLIWLHEGPNGWEWGLVDEDRSLLASGGSPRDTLAQAEDAVEHVQRLAPDAAEIDFGVASYELINESDEDGEKWRWRFIDSDRRTIAESTETYGDRDEARDGIADVKQLIPDASILEIDSAAFELHAVEDGWLWRLVDQNGNALAESIQSYETRTKARDAMEDVKELAPDGWIQFSEGRGIV